MAQGEGFGPLMLPSPFIHPLSDEQVRIGDVVLGSGTSYTLTDFNPWDASDVVASDVALGARPGVVSGFNVYKSRPVSFKVFISGSPDTKETTQALGQALRYAMAPTSVDIALHFKIGGKQYFLMGRPRAVKADMKRWGAGHLSFDCRFLATDPRIYEASIQTASGTAFNATSAGLNFTTASGGSTRGALDFNPSGSGAGLRGYLNLLGSSTAPSSPVYAYNSGTISTPWQAQITPTAGTLSGLTVLHEQTQRKLVLSGLQITSETTLYLDSTDHAVLLYSGVNYVGKRNLLSSTSTWWDLLVGDNTFTITVSTGTANITVNWYTTEV